MKSKIAGLGVALAAIVLAGCARFQGRPGETSVDRLSGGNKPAQPPRAAKDLPGPDTAKGPAAELCAPDKNEKTGFVGCNGIYD